MEGETIMKLVASDIVRFSEKYSARISTALLFFIPAICFYAFQRSIFYYQENNSLFIFSSDFLWKFICKPGGLLQYSGLFLTQGYFNSFYGALAVSSAFALLGKVFSGIIKQLSGGMSCSVLLMIIPSCLLMLLQRRFDHLMEFNLGFLLASAGFLLLLKLNKRHRALIPFLVPFFFFLAGSFTLITLCMYAIHSIVYEKGRSWFMIPGLSILSALITFLVFREFLFLQPAKLLIWNPLQNYASGLPVLFVLGYFIFFPVIIRSVNGLPGRFSTGLRVAIIFLAFSATAFMLTRKQDPITAENEVLRKMVNSQDWNGIISLHESSPSANIIGQYYYNIALSETDQLCNRLFKGRQDFGSGSLKLPDDEKLTGEKIYYYYALGLINEAHHLATESLIKDGYKPENIKFIIRTEIIRGNYRVAAKFLNILRRTLHYRAWAGMYEKIISDPDLIRSDPELRRKRDMLPKGDFFIKPIDSLNLGSALRFDPLNHVAFEYRMAGLLFEKDLKTITREAAKMEEIGYNYIPEYIGEAIVEACYMNKEVVPGVINSLKDTESRFRHYLDDYNKNKCESSFEGKMKAEWGDTFWYYYDFR